MGLFGFGKKKPMRTIACKDAGIDCNAVFKAKTDDEVMKQAGEHAQTVHKMTPTPELTAKIKGLIKNA